MTFKNKQGGMLLLEGLIAIFIFSLGVIAVIGMQMASVRQVTDAKYRSDAGLLVDELIGTMWMDNRDTPTLQAKFNTGGLGYTAWLEGRVKTTLPGVNDFPPTVNVAADGMVTVTLNWLAPGENLTTPHRHVAISQIR